jgi:AcrR family transcriptional regulator
MPYLPAVERRAQVVAAATRVIARVGLDHATTRLIAAEADAPLGSLHYLFKDKSELVAAVYEHWHTTTLGHLIARDLDGVGLEACIRALVLDLFGEVLSDEASMQVPYELLLWATREPGGKDFAARIYRDFCAFYADSLRRAEPALAADVADVVARFIAHTTDGVMLHYLAERDADAARASLRRYCDLARQLAGLPVDPVYSGSASSR